MKRRTFIFIAILLLLVIAGSVSGETEEKEVGQVLIKEYLSESQDLESDNLSSLSIGFRDKDDDRILYGVEIEIDGIRYTIYQESQAILYNLAEGKLRARIISVPEKYILPRDEFEIEIGDNDTHEELIRLERKKGAIKVTTSNAKKATYDIINSEFRVVRNL